MRVDPLAKKNRAPLVFAGAVLAIASIFSSVSQAARSYAKSHGYISDVRAERAESGQDIAFVYPPPAERAPLRDRIFTEGLSREFRERYQQQFGYTEAEQAYFAPNRSTYYSDLYGFQGTPEQNNDARRWFGEYMVRRLAEFHVDNYAKNDPQTRVVWEAKERISSLKVEVATFRFDARYSFAGNIMDIYSYSPYGDARVSLRAADSEVIVSLFRKLDPRSIVESHYYASDGVASVIGRRLINPLFSTSLTASTFVQPRGRSIRESLYLASLQLRF